MATTLENNTTKLNNIDRLASQLMYKVASLSLDNELELNKEKSINELIDANKIIKYDEDYFITTTEGIYKTDCNIVTGKLVLEANLDLIYYHNNIILAGGYDGLYFSNDHGETWTKSINIDGIITSIEYNNRWIIGTNKGIYHSREIV